MTDKRPSPDELLRRVQQEQARAERGRLKIFLGASPGVGKTFSMLEMARTARQQGLDVAVGVVETHGRQETARLLEGLETLPRRDVEYRGTSLKEFDLDGALLRHPYLLVVDELAHTNAPGSRHVKRWQDVEELLAAGINVYTTLNIQHLESLNDVVAQITGVTMRETVPDSILDQADELELVDVSPDVLIERLRQGKVYVPEQAQRALDRFFRRGNLMALRELALRRTAQQVDAEILDWRATTGIQTPAGGGERVLIAVGPNADARRLVRAGWRLATALRGECVVLHIETPEVRRARPAALAGLAEALKLGQELGARCVTVTATSVSEELEAWAAAENVTRLVIGYSASRWGFRWRRPVAERVLGRDPGWAVTVIGLTRGEEKTRPVRPPPSPARSGWRETAAALAWIGVAAVVGLAVRDIWSTTDIAMLFLLAVTVAGVRSRPGPALVAACTSIVVFDFGFVPPYYTFAVSDVSYVLTFIVMLSVAISVSRLTSRTREQAVAARSRERRSLALLSLAEELATADTAVRVSEALRRTVRETGADVVLLVPGPDGTLENLDATAPPLDAKEITVAQWAYSRRSDAGWSTDTLPSAALRWFPLAVGDAAVGALGVRPPGNVTAFSLDQLRFLDAAADQGAIALERLRLADRTRRDQVEIESERLRTALLSSLSHDMRTPLAAVEGAATTIRREGSQLAPAATAELLDTIIGEARRMGTLIRNLLEMVRLESGVLQVQREWQSLEEIVGLALLRLERLLSGHPVTTDIPGDLPLLRADGLLLELVIVNLLENAANHAGPTSPIEIGARAVEGSVEVAVRDHGPGVPADQREAIFEKFRRLGQGSGQGVGLGLAICRGIVQAHGGRIWAEGPPDGGLRIVFRIPLPAEQPSPIPEA